MAKSMVQVQGKFELLLLAQQRAAEGLIVTDNTLETIGDDNITWQNFQIN